MSKLADLAKQLSSLLLPQGSVAEAMWELHKNKSDLRALFTDSEIDSLIQQVERLAGNPYPFFNLWPAAYFYAKKYGSEGDKSAVSSAINRLKIDIEYSNQVLLLGANPGYELLKAPEIR